MTISVIERIEKGAPASISRFNLVSLFALDGAT